MGKEARQINYGISRDFPRSVEYGFWAFLLIAVGRINQLIPPLSSLPLAKGAIAFTVLALFYNRQRWPRLLLDAQSLAKTAIWLIGLSIILTPLSIWHGGSLAFLMSNLPVLVAATTVACVMGNSWKSVRNTMLVLVICGLVLAFPAVIGYRGGRAGDSDTMYDPNDLAYLLVTVLPLAIGFLSTSKGIPYRILYGFIVVMLSAATLLTQSRGGLLGFVTVILLTIFAPMKARSRGSSNAHKRSLALKVGILVLMGGLGTIVWSQLPQSAQQRYSSLLHLDSDYNMNTDNVTGRGSIWIRGLDAFAARPIGYGPQTYATVDARFGGKWKAPHNSFLQVLVELGAIGLVLFLRMYVVSLRGLQRVCSRLAALSSPSKDMSEQVVFARALQIAVAANMVVGFFLSDAYATVLWVIFGLCMGLCAIALTDYGLAKGSRSVRPLATQGYSATVPRRLARR